MRLPPTRTTGCVPSPTAYFERNPDKAVIPRLQEALNVEASEFVRPALTRALAAHADDPAVRQTMEGLVMKGQVFFRSVVIEAIGDHRGAYALKSLIEVVEARRAAAG